MHQGFLMQVAQHHPVTVDCRDPANKALTVDDEVIDVQAGDPFRQQHLVHRLAQTLVGFHPIDGVPEGPGYLMITPCQ